MKNIGKTMTHNKLLTAFIFLCGLFLTGAESYAGKKGGDTTDPVYKRLFRDKSKHRSEKGMLTVHSYDGRIYFEMPVKLLERDFLMSTVIPRSSDIRFAGTDGGVPQHYLKMERTDSLVLFRKITSNIFHNPDDEAQRKAMKLSKEMPIYRSFPIKGYTKDSLNVIYEVSELYKPGNRELVNLKNLPYGGFITISGFSLNASTSFFNSIHAYETAVMVSNTLSGKIDLNLLGLLPLPTKPNVTMEVNSYLVMLPKEKMAPRAANRNVGTGVAHYYDYTSMMDTKWKEIVTRHRLAKGQELPFYIDTLISPEWRAAIAGAAEEWNKVFEQNDMGRPITLRPFPSEAGFRHQDPQRNTIVLVPSGGGGGLQVNNITDPRTGEIISSRITVSQDVINFIRNTGTVQLSAVDERFRSYDISREVISEGIRGLSLRAFGQALGLSENLAGSYAYSPENIRSAAFTKANGFTASVMDKVLYNTLARPGDREKGVMLVIHKVGTADAFALKYLYADFGPRNREEEALKAYVRKHEGDPRFLYIGASGAIPSDPRGMADDLGNDPIQYLQNRIDNMKYMVRNSPQWFASDSVPDAFKNALPDLVATEYFSSITGPLYNYVGGFHLNELSQSSSLPPFVPIDRTLQARVVKALMAAAEDETWFNEHPRFLSLGGMNTRLTEYTANQGIPIRALVQRLKYMSIYAKVSQPTYTQAELLDEIERFLFVDIEQGRPLSQRKQILLRTFISVMTEMSPSLILVDKANKKSGKAFADLLSPDAPRPDAPQWGHRFGDDRTEEALRATPALPYFSLPDFTPMVYRSFQRCAQKLKQSKAAGSDPRYRLKMDYYLQMIDNLIAPTRQP